MISREFGLVLRQEVMAVIDVWVMTWGGILDMMISSRYKAFVVYYTLNSKIAFRPQILSLYRVSESRMDVRNILHCIFASNLCPMYQYSDIEILINTLLNP